MVEGQSMTVADVVAQVRDGRLDDFVKEAVALVAREMMEAEVSAEVGAGLGEIAPESRVTGPQWIPPEGVGDPGRGDRSAGPEETFGSRVLPDVLGSAPAG
jgi:hypothetical protein